MKSEYRTGRDSLITTAAHHARWFARLATGTAVLGSTAALAVDNLWTGSIDKDWNKTGNWSLGRVPAQPNSAPTGDNFDDAIINTLTNFPVLTVNPSAVPRDIAVGGGGSNTGRLDVRAGTAATGGTNWGFVGRQGSTGTLNVADTSGTGGTLTGFAKGSGSFTAGGRIYVGGNQNTGGGTGTLNVNTTGAVSMGNDFAVGSSGGTGVTNIDAGTVTTNGWSFIGKREAQDGGVGTVNLGGGTMTHNGSRCFIGVGNAFGTFNLSGGTYNNPNGGDSFVVVGSNNLGNANTSALNITGGTMNVNRLMSVGGVQALEGDTNADFVNSGKGSMTLNGASAVVNVTGELWFGQGANSVGTLTFSAGTINVNNWVAIGRGGGSGTVNMTGGTWTKTGGGNFIVGASGPGTMTQSAGLVDVQAGIMWIGEQNNATASYTLSGTGEIRSPEVVLGVNGGTNATLDLNAGTLRTARIAGGGGTEAVSFNGAQIVVKSQPADFIASLDTATIAAGGLKVDTNGFNATASQVFTGSGPVLKTGAGTLTLSGASTNTGAVTVSAGKLIGSTSATGAGAFTVANGAGMGARVNVDPEQFNVPSVVFGTAGGNTSVDIVCDSSVGNPASAPLKITGNATLNGPVAVNLVDAFPEVGTYAMVQYGTKSGSGSFVLGTLPLGVIGTLNDNGSGLVTLTVTSVAQPRWNATASNAWDTTTINWLDNLIGNPIKYTNGNPVIFDDTAAGTNPGTVTITQAVTPGSVIFNNSTPAVTGLDYVVGASGGGAIGGTTGLTKQNSGDVSLTTNHTYTGVTRLEGGTLTVNSIANGGVASSIGASTADPANLVLAGGTLVYTGASTTSTRGFTHAGVDGNVMSGIKTTNDLTLSGAVTVSSFGRLTKTGAGNLTLSNPGANVLGSGGAGAVQVNGGTLTLSGGATQANQVLGELWVGATPDVPANFAINSGSLTTSSWIALGRGNGSTGAIVNFTATNSVITTVNFSTGFDNGLAGNNSVQNVTLTNSTVTNNGVTFLAESLNSHTTLTLNGSSSWTANDRLQIGLGDGSSADIVINDSGSLTKTAGWFSIGNSGTGTGSLTVNGNGTVNSAGDFNIGDVGTSHGVVNINGSGSLTSTGIVFVGKNTGTGGIVNQTGGTFTGTTWVSNARFDGSTGAINVSGGSFNQTGAAQALWVAEEGSGVITLSATGAINVTGTGLMFGNAGTANSTFNLDGGTLTAKQLAEGGGGAGTSAFNFNGGTLKAGTGANANFMAALDTVTVKAGGAKIDSNGQAVAVNASLLDGTTGGGLTKLGAGTLYLNGINTYLGLTTVSAGTLAGTGVIAGSVSVANGATIAGGIATGGTLSVSDNVSFLSGANFGVTIGTLDATLAVEDNLSLTNANLVLTGTPTAQAYIIATYGTLTGTFATLPTLPAGYSVNYHYNGSNEVAIVRPPNAFDTWINTYFPGVTDQSIVGPTADPDGDGYQNSLEFALGGVPNDASNNPKVYQLIGDSSDAGTASELMMTIAVRNGTPVFAGTPSPSATQDGYTYTVQGSQTLSTFTSAVSVVTPVTTGLPAAPTGYTYRTFSLDASNTLTGTANRGFMRVNVTP